MGRLCCTQVYIDKRRVASLGVRSDESLRSSELDDCENSTHGALCAKIDNTCTEFRPYDDVFVEGDEGSLLDGWLIWRSEVYYVEEFESDEQLNGNQGSWTNSDDVKTDGDKGAAGAKSVSQAERARRHKESINHQKRRQTTPKAGSLDDALKQLDGCTSKSSTVKDFGSKKDPSIDKRNLPSVLLPKDGPKQIPKPKNQNQKSSDVVAGGLSIKPPDVAEPKVSKPKRNFDNLPHDSRPLHKTVSLESKTSPSEKVEWKPTIALGAKPSAAKPVLTPIIAPRACALKNVFLYVMPALYGKSSFRQSVKKSKFEFVDVDDLLVDDEERKKLRQRACTLTGWDAKEAWQKHNSYVYTPFIVYLGKLRNEEIVVLCHSDLRLVNPIIADLILPENVFYAPYIEDAELTRRARGNLDRLAAALCNNGQHKTSIDKYGGKVVALDVFLDDAEEMKREEPQVKENPVKKVDNHQIRRLAIRSAARAAGGNANGKPVEIEPLLLGTETVLHGEYAAKYQSLSDGVEAKKYLDSVKEGALTYKVMDIVLPAPPDPHLVTVATISEILILNEVEADPLVIIENLYLEQTRTMARLRAELIQEMTPLRLDFLSDIEQYYAPMQADAEEKRLLFWEKCNIPENARRGLLQWDGGGITYDARLHNPSVCEYHFGLAGREQRESLRMVGYALKLRGTDHNLAHVGHTREVSSILHMCNDFQLGEGHVDFGRLFRFDENTQPKHAASVRRLKSYFDFKSSGVSSLYGKMILRDKEVPMEIVFPPIASQTVDPLCKQLKWMNTKTKKPLKLEMRELPSLPPKNSFGKTSGFERFKMRFKYASRTLTRRFLLTCVPYFTHDVNVRRNMLQHEVAPVYLANHDVAFWDGTRSSALGYTGYQKNVLIETDLCSALIDTFVSHTAFNNDLISRMNFAANKWLKDFTNWEPGDVELLNNCVRYTFVTLQLNRFTQSETLKVSEKVTPSS